MPSTLLETARQQTHPNPGKVARIPTLDGWRGIAILPVVVGHAATYSRFHGRLWASQGGLGVDTFFVVSGYIITERLLSERLRTGSFSLRHFYIRRARRILPVVATYLAVLFALSRVVTIPDMQPTQLIGALFFFRNYQIAMYPVGQYTGHFWSLSIEEHFYLLWPALLLYVGNKRALWLSLLGAIACALWRIHDYSGSWVSRLLEQDDLSPWFHAIRTDARIDGLMLGCALALLLRIQPVRSFIFQNFPKELPLFCACALLLVAQHSAGLPTFLGYVLITLALCSTLVVREGLAYIWLNSVPLMWVGRISFSLYVWQQLFLIHPAGSTPMGFFGRGPFNLLFAFAAASASYYLIEQRRNADNY